MQILLEVKSPSELWALLEYLRSLKDVNIILPPKNGAEKEEEGVPGPGPSLKLIAALQERDIAAVRPAQVQKWDFSRFYGAAKTGMAPEQMDERLDQLRSEWERDI